MICPAETPEVSRGGAEAMYTHIPCIGACSWIGEELSIDGIY